MTLETDIEIVHGGLAGGPAAIEAFERVVTMARGYLWVLPIMTGEDDVTATRRTQALAAGLMKGLSGEQAINWAMKAAP